MSTDFLVAGAFIGSILTFVAIAIPRYTRHILAATLVGAALVYIHLAVDAHAGVSWLATEVTGVAIFGALAVRGVRRSAWWLAAGWALHPAWDVALHFAGPGHAFAPDWYTVSCITWDLATAAIIAVAILIGTHLSEPLSLRAERARSAREVEESLPVSPTPLEGTTTARFLDSALRAPLGMTERGNDCTCTATEARAA
jgi:hypothetical protein